MSWRKIILRLLSGPLSSETPARAMEFDTVQSLRPAKLGRVDVIRLIEENGGPEGLDLSTSDLSGANLQGLNLRGIVFGVAGSSVTVGGKGANLAGVKFSHCDLTRANLSRTNLRGARFSQTNLYEASLVAAEAQEAYFERADLRRADLYDCALAGASLYYVQVDGANFRTARIADAEITGADLGESILQEDEKKYEEYFQRWYATEVAEIYKHQHLAARYKEAAEIYMNLKNSSLSHGRYIEASHYHIKERVMRRATLAPWRASDYHEKAIAHSRKWLSWRRGWFYMKYTLKWTVDWMADLSCGYGERPLRTVLVAAVIVLVFPFLFYWSGGVTSDSGVMTVLDYVNYSLGAFTTIGFNQFQARTPLAQTLTSLEAMLGISLLALLMFSLGNRISRS